MTRTLGLKPQASSLRLWIKICGLTTAEAVRAAVTAGVDAVGFVFYRPSKRWIAPETAAQLAALVPDNILKVAVTLHPSQTEVDAVLAAFRPDVWQTDWQDLAQLSLPSGIAVLPVARSGEALPEPLPSRLLFEGPVSGVGATIEWGTALPLVHRCELILAGGLHPGNVASAVADVRPFGVDVSSGVERVPGIKDPDLIREFVEAARSGGRTRESLP